MARDKYHYLVKDALIKDGWTITHDPYKIMIGRRKGYIDLGAEIIGAKKDNQIIAVEIKSFLGVSDLDQFEDALGQFLVYLFALRKLEEERILYLATPREFYENFFSDPFFVELCEFYKVKIIVYDEVKAIIKKWIN
ncbi:MAG: fatty-acid oxidation protein subunit alpha [Saprospiraceae bacterium]|nr:fatty-acid oxidation protein subunit alpha [Saprospiraceae bacterium]